MHTKGPKEDPLVDLGYEARDVDARRLLIVVSLFFTFATVCFIIGGVLYHWWNSAFDQTYAHTPSHRVLPGPPNPLLQSDVTAKTDIMALRQAETKQLTGTGWNATHTEFHIPIERAIDLIAQRGLPPVNAAVPAVSKGNTTDQRREPEPGAPVPASESPTARPSVIPPVPTTKPPTTGPPSGGPPSTMPPTTKPPAGPPSKTPPSNP